MEGDTISEWIILALFCAVVFGVLAASYVFKRYFYEPEPDDATKPDNAIQDQKGWVKTGRVDFFDPESIGTFILRVEETRIVDGIGRVVHREIRWRNATLEEADDVLVAYHSERKLMMAPNYTVTSSNVIRGDLQARIEQTPRKLKSRRTKASVAQSKEYAKSEDDANDVLPKADAQPREYAKPEDDANDVLPKADAQPREYAKPEDDANDVLPKADAQPQEDAKPEDDANDVLPKAAQLVNPAR